MADDMLPSTVTFVNGRLCYCGQNCRKIPEALCKLYGPKVHCLDLSFNELTSLKGLDAFPNIQELVLDNNQLSDTIVLPNLPKLHTLSLNKNNICDLEPLLTQIRDNAPNLTYLSLLGNKACPNQLSCQESNEEDYIRYRYFVLYHLPGLRFLDSNKVEEQELVEAKRRGQFMNVIRPKMASTADNRTTRLERDLKYSPLPRSLRNPQDYKGVYGRCRYRYSGKHSEGNRFICNNDL
ncbi:leucine-rich melanocyte differentiation-associated protein-like isoform X2 [Rhynchophorus ferrugineus]|uniref:leucine-rich melanocyte differentiation-associated protein-like isoform X2 n=1 Tax=Rhynchophorus ferrugineus TaxID=354439 RepID=UPI003FCE31BB